MAPPNLHLSPQKQFGPGFNKIGESIFVGKDFFGKVTFFRIVFGSFPSLNFLLPGCVCTMSATIACLFRFVLVLRGRAEAASPFGKGRKETKRRAPKFPLSPVSSTKTRVWFPQNPSSCVSLKKIFPLLSRSFLFSCRRRPAFCINLLLPLMLLSKKGYMQKRRRKGYEEEEWKRQGFSSFEFSPLKKRGKPPS